MGKPMRSLKIIVAHEASLRRLCLVLARELRDACAGLPASTAPTIQAALVRVHVRLEAAALPVEIVKPASPTKKKKVPHAT
jgi:hypothetical protein